VSVFTAHVREDRAPRLVREGFAWWAALFGPLWLLFAGAWVPALLDAALIVLLAVLVPRPFAGALDLLLFLLHGCFARDLLRWSLALRGYRPEAVVCGRGAEDALRRLLALRPGLLSSARARAL
jgi:hypothetical protein